MNVLDVGEFKDPNGNIGPVLVIAVDSHDISGSNHEYPITCVVINEDGTLGSELYLRKTWDNFIPLKAKIKVEIERNDKNTENPERILKYIREHPEPLYEWPSQPPGYYRTVGDFGTNDPGPFKVPSSKKAPAPHCDPLILHAPGTCEFCDEYPEEQRDRIIRQINFTGEHKPGRETCPSELCRPLEVINRWPNNRPFQPELKK